ncbi:hypothetical protein [Nostoc sp.]|uniref:hypothetical protein n=1 Tax=Nostoc sp. TaxID=1180 RepID=UPI002FF9F4FA
MKDVSTHTLTGKQATRNVSHLFEIFSSKAGVMCQGQRSYVAKASLRDTVRSLSSI